MPKLVRRTNPADVRRREWTEPNSYEVSADGIPATIVSAWRPLAAAVYVVKTAARPQAIATTLSGALNPLCVSTYWVQVTVRHVGTETTHIVACDPLVPRCTRLPQLSLKYDRKKHDFREIAALCSPEAQSATPGDDATARLRRVCVHCGCVRTTGNDGVDPKTQTSGLPYVTYSFLERDSPGFWQTLLAARSQDANASVHRGTR